MKRTVTLILLLLFLTVTLRAAPGPGSPPPLSTGPDSVFMAGSIVVKGEGIAPDDKRSMQSASRIRFVLF